MLYLFKVGRDKPFYKNFCLVWNSMTLRFAMPILIYKWQ